MMVQKTNVTFMPSPCDWAFFMETILSSYILFISGQEIIVVFLIFLLLFGAKSIPGLARTMGRAMRQFKDASQDIQREMRNAADDVNTEIRKQRTALDQMDMDTPPAKPKPNHSDSTES